MMRDVHSIIVTDADSGTALVWYPGTSTFHVHTLDPDGAGIGREIDVFTCYGDDGGNAPTVEYAARIMADKIEEGS